LSEFLEEKRKEEEKKLKKFDTEIKLNELLKNNKRYMNIGRNKNYKIVKTKDEALSQREDDKDENDEDADDFYKVKLRKFKKNKRIIKAYENMKIINDTYKSSLGLECPRYVRNFERYDNREFYKDNQTNLATIIRANKNSYSNRGKEFGDKLEHNSHDVQNSTSNTTPLSMFIKKKIILPKIF
jgi:hypothetical protein